MDTKTLRNLNITEVDRLPTPDEVKSKIEIPDEIAETVNKSRQTIEDVLDSKDDRLVVVLGPCSIHDSKAAIDYANRLKQLSDKVIDKIFLVMRVYFEKPRTSVGWKGFINDPYLDDSFRIEEGLYLARQLLVDISRIGLPIGTEALDPITPQYLDDLVSWYAIGARTAESQTHREMASGLSSPVGIKNATDGSVMVAINALKSVREPHRFLGIDQNGCCSVFTTRGNQYAHTVLRGGSRPNYDAVSVSIVEQELEKHGLPKRIMIDCSHGNSNKDARLQPLVFKNCIQQIVDGNKNIKALMLESNLKWGSQEFTGDKSALEYGVSVTDACIDWETTEQLILDAYNQL